MHPEIDLLNINVDYNLKLHADGDFWGKVLYTVIEEIEKFLKPAIRLAISTFLKGTISSAISEALDEINPDFPLVSNITLDCTLAKYPIVREGFLVVYLKGIFKHNLKESQHLLPADPIASYDSKGMGIQVGVSGTTINSALASISKSGLVNININGTIIPQDLPIQLDTTFLDSIFFGLKALYGPNKPITINVLLKDYDPNLVLESSKLSLSIPVRLVFKVLITKELSEEFIIIDGLISASANLKIDRGLKPEIQIFSVEASQFIALPGYKVKDPGTEALESIINLSMKLGIPIANEMIKKLKIQIPVIMGINLNDIELSLPDKFLKVSVNPEYDINKIVT